VQIRGAHGEHTETDDHIYDISNKRRLGRSEVDLVQDMYNGVKAMIEAEKALRPQEAIAALEVAKPEEQQAAEVGDAVAA
jgi:protein-arginine kinase